MNNAGLGLIPNVSPTVRKTFEDFDLGFSELFEDLFHLVNIRNPKSVFHYTNDFGLRSILDSNKLWMSDIFSMNDPSELHYGIKTFQETFTKMPIKHGHIQQNYSKFIENFYKEKIIQKILFAYSTSFSTKGNDLTQWRSYGDNGRGYCIEFSYSDIEDYVKSIRSGESPITSTYFMLYSRKKAIDTFKIFSHLIVTLIGELSKQIIPDEHKQEVDKAVRSIIIYNALTLTSFFKDKAFSHEKEYRILQLYSNEKTHPDTKFKVRNHDLIRYVEFSLDKIPVKSIRIGPASDKKKSKIFLNKCFSHYLSYRPSITDSRIPYFSV
jgi:hypothetical protein